MKTFLAIVTAAFLLLPSAALPQGALAPPGPPAPTMKTLDQVQPRTPVDATHTPGDSVNLFIITNAGSYYLTTNVFAAPAKNGISILTNDVTLDLNGFTLRGAGNGIGVNVSGFSTNIAVYNGILQQWTYGLYANNANNCRFDHLLSSQNSTGLTVGDGTLVADCCATSNVVYGISVATGCQVLNCIARANGNGGINASTGASIIGCVVEYNGADGIFLDRGVVKDCTARQNTGNGINAFINCLVLDNTCLNNGGAGVTAGNGGHRIEGNNVVANSRGIAANPATGNLIIRNSATGNATNYDINIANTAGPIINSANIASSSNPHANYSY